MLRKGMKPQLKSTTARQIVQDFPGISKSALAAKLFDLYPTLYKDKEEARSFIRTVTGANGKNSAVDITEYTLPESKAKERSFYRIERNNILWLSDIHIPNQNNEAIELAVSYGLSHNVNCILLGGDIMDNTPFTAHDAPPPSPNDVRDYFEMTEQFLGWLRSKFPTAHIVWIEGNHDQWMMRWLMRKAPILFNDPYYHLPQRLNLKKYNVDFLEQHIIVQMGKLYGSHGHTIVKGVFAPVNAARGAFVKTKSNYIIGHVHSTSHHGESNIKEDAIGCWSVGCLCELSPSYDPHNTKHNLGFARIIVEDNGDFTVENKRIFKGKIV